MITFHTAPQGSPEWLEARRGVCTGSRFKDARDRSDGLDAKQRTYVEAIRAGKTETEARDEAGYKAAPTSDTVKRAVAGTLEKQWGADAIAYARDLARERLGGRAPDAFIRKVYGDTGHASEADARVRMEAKFGLLIDEAGFAVTEDRKFGLSVDGLIDRDGTWECKAMVSSNTMFTALVDGDIQEYRDQCQGGLWLTGRKYALLTLWAPDLPSQMLPPIRIDRDEAYIEALEKDLMAFERLVCEHMARLSKVMSTML